VNKQDLQLPSALQAIPEVSLDGGKLRLRTPKGQECEWRDYKTVRLSGIYYRAFFSDNQSLLDWVNSQKLINPLVCLGDGLSGRVEVVCSNWKFSVSQPTRDSGSGIKCLYNLHKVGGSIKR
jgi:hypothetical protein